jgi:Inhibitor of growth proteins N-terminal histone-binding
MNSSSEETYLEAFIEQLTTSQFSYQLRRTIDMLRDLDTTYHADLTVLRQLSDEFITNVENKIVQTLDVVEMDHDHPDMDADEPDEVSERTKKRRRPVYGVRAITTDGTASSEHPVILPTTEELMEYILRQKDTDSDDIGSNATTDKPTMDHIYKQILHLQKECLQKADEKVTISQQAYEMIDAQVQRLDTDLAAMEQLLQVINMCGVFFLYLSCLFLHFLTISI